MDCTLQEINVHKQMLINLVNKLINTQLINEEISINNEIKKESECLNSLFNIKQNNLMNRINQNNFNKLMFQQNQMMFPSPPIVPVNMNPFSPQKPKMFLNNNFQNNFENFSNKNNSVNDYYNCVFRLENGKCFVFECKPSEKVVDVIEKYRERTKDYYNTIFLVDGNNLMNDLNLTLEKLCQKYRRINPYNISISV